jgi:anti-repressor protein
MDKLIVKQVRFNGDSLLAVKDNETGKIHVAVYYVCKGLGLTEGQMKNERSRIQDDIVLSKGGRKIVLPTNGGNQDVLCIELEYLPLWLAKINANIIQNETTQNKLIEYQLKAKDVLAEAFLGQSIRLPSNFGEACRMLADEWEQKQKLLAENTEMRPKAEFADALHNSEGLILVRDYVKILANDGIKTTQKELFQWFVANGYMYTNYRGDYLPQARYIQQGLFKVLETPIETSTTSFIGYTSKLTGKGQQYFYEKLKEEQLCLSK